MDVIKQEIDRLLQFLESWRKIYNNTLAQSPEGGLVRGKQGHTSFFMRTMPNGRYSNGKIRYAKTVLSEDSTLLKQLALKEYCRIVLKTLEQNIRCLEQAKAGLLPMSFEAIHSGMRKPYRVMPDGFFRDAFTAGTISERHHRWAAEPYELSDYRPEERIHTTSRGLKMRTRSEVVIAELLYKYDIPFRYEQVLCIGKYTMAPDFTFLDAEGKEFYWEYCGMMSDAGYRNRQIWRRGLYEGAGICEWDNMIYTYDKGESIDVREIEAIIKAKILPKMKGA